jgi:hypothetical protein
MKPLLILIACCFFFIRCSDDEFNIKKIRGTWIESERRLDTLIFHDDDLEGLFTFNRPREMQDGQLLPLPGSGMFSYSIKNDSITMQLSLLSCWCPRQFPFRTLKNGNQIAIGNFYDDQLPVEKILFFDRL